jgi:hypothetical protein
VGTTWYGDTLVLNFSPGVTAAGADVFAINPPLGPLAGSFEVDVFNGTTHLDGTTFSEAAGAYGFIGASSTTPITSMQLVYSTADEMTMATNIEFGLVPEPGTVGVIGAGIWTMLARRRSSRTLGASVATESEGVEKTHREDDR